MAVTTPPAAVKLRRLMNLAQIVQSHALSFFHLSSPDLILGFDSDPAKRNVFGLIAADRELARGGIRLRQFGQEIIERLGGKKIHPAWSVPGGVRGPLGPRSTRRPSAAASRRRRPPSLAALARFKAHARSLPRGGRRRSAISRRSSWAWSAADGTLGALRRQAPVRRRVRQDRRRRARRASGISEFIGEATQHDSYLKSPYYQAAGLSRRHLPRRPAGPAEHLRADADAAGRRRSWREYRARGSASPARRSSTTTPASSRSSPASSASRWRSTTRTCSRTEHLRPTPGSTASRASASARRRGARCSTTTRWTRTG